MVLNQPHSDTITGGSGARNNESPSGQRRLRRLLIVSPHFPPTNAPDHQRVRMALDFLLDFGWQATILAVSPEATEAITEPLLASTLPSGLDVVRTNAWATAWTRRLGLGSLAMRSYPFLRRAGHDLLSSGAYDAMFFSTTQFLVMALARTWREKFGVPYVLDFQDPWRNDYYKNTGVKPPGGKVKFAIANTLASLLEPQVLRSAAHIITVSPAYPEMLMSHYNWLRSDQFTVLPFGAKESDFTFLQQSNVRQSVFDPSDGKRHWVYVGRAGRDMGLALRAFFHALKSAVHMRPELSDELRLHFVGTTYAPDGRALKTVEPIAREYGFDGIVNEQTARVPYFEALRCLLDADALVVPGSDDSSYTASKIYPYILAKKPLLAIFHGRSTVIDVLSKTGAGTAVSFRDGETADEVAERIVATNWLCGPPIPSTNWTAFQQYTAREMTLQLCKVLDGVVGTPT